VAGPPRLYAIADAEILAPVELADAVETMVAAGVSWIQVRAKVMADDELFRQLKRIEGSIDKQVTTIWIDDRVDFVAAFGFGGVHLGQADLPPREARRIVPANTLIGRSTHSVEEVQLADRDRSVDVIAVGPIFETVSKQAPDPVVGLEFIRAARRETTKPLLAIGGIDSARIDSVLTAGANTGVVLGDLCRGDLEANLERYLPWIDRPWIDGRGGR
jgi:thiamine-phosphate pyrophosphorylase